MVVDNPCETASFTTAYLVNSLSTNVGADSVGTQYNIPTDSVSSLYGDSYTLCGERVRYL